MPRSRPAKTITKVVGWLATNKHEDEIEELLSEWRWEVIRDCADVVDKLKFGFPVSHTPTKVEFKRAILDLKNG